MDPLAIASPTALTAALPARTRSTRPRANVRSIRNIQNAPLTRDRLVTLKGYIRRFIRSGLYEFSDGTGIVYLDVGTPHLPADRLVSKTSLVEVHGKYIDEALSHDKIKVLDLRFAA